MTLEEEINEIVETFAEGVIAGIKNNIETKAVTSFGPMNNTGEAANSLGWSYDGKSLKVFSNMAGSFNYIMVLETGRKPGKMPPIQNIETWLEQRGISPPDIIQKSLAFLIARKTGREGSKLYREGGNSGVITDYTNKDYINQNLFKVVIEAVQKALIDRLTEPLQLA